MQFNSYSYLLALTLAVFGFWLLPVRLRRPYVLGLSLAFYATWNVWFIFIPLLMCVIAFICGRIVRDDTQRGRWALAIGIGLIVLILGIFKYERFVAANLALILPWLKSHPIPAMYLAALPLGISFYSFEAISYLLDNRQRRAPSASFTDLCLFVMFWPHLIAGPIVRSRELIPQLKFDRPFEFRFTVLGMDRLLLGLVQKNVIANNLGSWVDDGFLPKIAALNTTVDSWFLAIAFGLQIYFDFAAYSNMAIGAATLIGITLPENFRFPYHAATPADFWSRWHITLSRWIRDYVFFPLSAGFQDRKVRLYLSLIGVMGLVGLWHGAGWGYILWGIMHGVYLVIYRALEGSGEIERRNWIARMGWRIFTLVAVTAAWVPFRSVSLGQAKMMWSSMFFHFSFGMSYSINFYLVTLLCCVLCLVEPYCGRVIRKGESLAENIGSGMRVNAYVLKPIVYACLLLMFLIFDDRDVQFIYFQF